MAQILTDEEHIKKRLEVPMGAWMPQNGKKALLWFGGFVSKKSMEGFLRGRLKIIENGNSPIKDESTEGFFRGRLHRVARIIFSDRFCTAY